MEKILTQSSLGQHSKAMISLILSNKNKHAYDNNEKHLCQSLYYKNPGAYTHLRSLLDAKLPSARTLIRWHELQRFNVGVVQEVISYLVQKLPELSEDEKELVLLFDEMDGKRGLFYEEKRDMFIGFEDLFGRKPKLVKKFLTIMIRGLTDKIGNIILANYGTMKGIKGIFSINFIKLL